MRPAIQLFPALTTVSIAMGSRQQRRWLLRPGSRKTGATVWVGEEGSEASQVEHTDEIQARFNGDLDAQLAAPVGPAQ
ncbi:hypothetical protein L226DRAFT_528560 [Lentinus tigrinus ALCF2SS1-7]|uniref:uncharacterized protein n=1 Tax=Lentinus tigrinus ALCF2SS1-7 TaxID=1328758 RepID=UPI001165F712|nr:hypothetical protein L226DRAFT_528560 [Lentinus tigrinus ALCF2SS1-7]